jgi:hypothetical protein
VYEQFKSTVETDLTLAEALPLLPLAASVNSNGQIHRYAIGPDNVDGFTTSSGGAVLLPQRDEVRAIMEQALSSGQ